MTISTVRGMKDILPPESSLWVKLEERIRDHFFSRGYREIRTPILEKSELFVRSIGETTDIVEKEMYTFTDKSGESVTMRPEGTASVVRAFLNGRNQFPDLPVRLFYLGPMFRHERPQKGRLRQFHQAGAEVLGSQSPLVDAEVLVTLWDLFESLGVRDVSLELNSLGCPECRPRYNEALLEFLSLTVDDLCADCRRRYERNPLRALDCKVPTCVEKTEKAPRILDYLCSECREHFERVRAALDSVGVPYAVNPRMVRGLDYYRRTTFEFLSGELGAQNAVAAGGRYDGLAEMLGSKSPVPGVGFAIGMERLILILSAEGWGGEEEKLPLFLALQEKSLVDVAFRLKRELEKQGLRCEIDYEGRSLKSQMRRANRLGAKFVVIFGEDEWGRGVVKVKNMEEG
ncbi:MAG: histidine--tRNA ligase, partial [Deltaproteobacteria bacterium]